jgi:nifR3 family TIM-barrel protein
MNPDFWIGNVPIYGRMALSPMAGISDSPYRDLCRRMGSAWSFTEFVSAEQILIGNPKTFRTFQFEKEERPVWFQIFGNSVSTVTEACKRILALEPDIIDLNMGCSVQKVSQKGSGAGLLRNLNLAGRIIEDLCKVSPVPITAKIRIGWTNDCLNYKETVKVLQESGVSGISVHGRTKEMAYTGRANWDVIAEIKSLAKVPIIGNGDIQSHAEAKERLRTSRVDAVLIGRGAIGNPWIFSGATKENLEFSEVYRVAREHYLAMIPFYGPDSTFTLFKKYFTKYFGHFSEYDSCRQTLLRIEKAADWFSVWEKSAEDYRNRLHDSAQVGEKPKDERAIGVGKGEDKKTDPSEPVFA